MEKQQPYLSETVIPRGELRRIALEAETATIECVRPWHRKLQPCLLAPHVTVPQWFCSEHQVSAEEVLKAQQAETEAVISDIVDTLLEDVCDERHSRRTLSSLNGAATTASSAAGDAADAEVSTADPSSRAGHRAACGRDCDRAARSRRGRGRVRGRGRGRRGRGRKRSVLIDPDEAVDDNSSADTSAVVAAVAGSAATQMKRTVPSIAMKTRPTATTRQARLQTPPPPRPRRRTARNLWQALQQPPKKGTVNGDVGDNDGDNDRRCEQLG